jgi:hypothetical protein
MSQPPFDTAVGLDLPPFEAPVGTYRLLKRRQVSNRHFKRRFVASFAMLNLTIYFRKIKKTKYKKFYF